MNSCTPLIVVGTTATAVIASMQDRTVGTIIDDKTLSTRLRVALSKHKISKNISIAIDEGRVLLTGNVKDSLERMRVAKVVWEQDGVREVMNEINVNDKEESFAKSTWITTQIKTKLLVSSAIKSLNYTVETYNGTVYLLGLANSKNEMEKVINIARRVNGVKQVVSYVRIKNSSLRFR